MPVLLWASAAREDLPRTYSILNLGVCALNVLLFLLLNSFVFPTTWFLFIFVIARAGIAVILYLGVTQRHLDKCKGWCILEVLLIIFTIITMIFGNFNPGFLVVEILMIALRVYGLWIIYNFVKELQIENGEDNTVASNFCPTPFRGIFQKNQDIGGSGGNTQTI